MQISRLHSWQVSPREAVTIQKQLAGWVSRAGRITNPRFIAGVDTSVARFHGRSTAAVVVLEYPSLRLVETSVVTGQVDFPYVPGLLSFREAPLTLAACEKLVINPDLILVDGQGIAHPRRLGLASHLGLYLDTPTIGCAKSLLCGQYEEPDTEPGSYSNLMDKRETIGAALRTRPGAKPLYISTGHRVDLKTAIRWVLECCRGYRLPEPNRLAHLAASGNLKSERVTLEKAVR
jgi:deoxyribonuclease V